MDLSTYILASFATVEQVRQAVDPASFTVVNFHLSDAAMAILKEAGLIAPQGHPFIHLGISDAKHDSLVIEFIEGGPLPCTLLHSSIPGLRYLIPHLHTGIVCQVLLTSCAD